MTTLTAVPAGGTWTTAATWSPAQVPTAADDVVLASTSGNVTVTANGVCRSLDCTGYTGTLGQSATLTIGTSTPGAGNIAIKLVAGMTYTSNTLIFTSTSATQQTVDMGGKTAAATMTFQGAGSSYLITSGFTSGAGIVHTAGTLDTNGQTLNLGSVASTGATTRVLTLGASTITCSSASTPWTISGSGITFNAGTSTINVSSSSSTIFAAATGMTYNNLVYTTAILGSASITGNATFNNITVSTSTTKTAQFTFAGSGTTTVSGTLTINGNSATNRLLIKSNVPGTPVTLSCAAVSFSHVDFMDIVGTGAASWNLSAITGLSGDCGGNSGITFTTAATQTCATATPAATWSGLSWSGRVPLPQDNAVISISGNSKSIQLDMARSGHNVDFSGTTGTGLSVFLGQVTSWFGDINLTNLSSFTTGSVLTLAGRGSHTIRTGGVSFGPSLTINTASSYQLLDNFTSTSATFTFSGGTFDLNGFNATFNNQIAASTRDWTLSLGGGTLQATSIVSSAAIARTVNMGTGGTISLITTSAVSFFQCLSGTFTYTGTGTIKVGAASANARSFDGGGFSYPKLQYTVNGSTGSLTITGTNTFSDIEFKDTTNARSLLFPAGVTTTVTGAFDVQGTSGKLMTIDSSTAATHTLSKASGTVACDFLSVKNSTATGGASWYAGANSTSVSGNTGWIFSAAPAIVTFTQTVHARIANTRTKTQTSNSRIANTRTKLQTAIAKMANSRIATQLAHSRIANTRTKAQTALGHIANTKTKLQTAIARIAIVKSATQTVRARIAVIRSLTQSLNARIATTRTKAQTATARIVPASIRSKAQTAAARIANTRTKTQTAIAKISGGTVKSKVQTVHARISNILTKAQTSNARIAKTVTKIQAVHARIGVPKTKTQTAKAWFSKGFTKIQTARARIGFQVSKRQTARARISNNLLTQQKANARIIQNRYKFQTPVGLGFMRAKRGFWHHMRPQASGITVLKENGYYREVVYPSQREISAAEIAYMGGHDHYVSQSEAAELVAAGYDVEVITHE